MYTNTSSENLSKRAKMPTLRPVQICFRSARRFTKKNLAEALKILAKINIVCYTVIAFGREAVSHPPETYLISLLWLSR